MPYIHIEKSYFYRFWDDFETVPLRVKAFTKLEEELQILDRESWRQLNTEAGKLCLRHNGDRGWSKLFEKLNEAKGYVYLQSLGCRKIRFISRSMKNGIETPDLEGEKNDNRYLCEVKTINVSDSLLKARRNIEAREVQPTLPAGLKNKLKEVTTKAHSQLSGYHRKAMKFAYLVISFDDELDYRDKLNIQTRIFINSLDFDDMKVIIHNEYKSI